MRLDRSDFPTFEITIPLRIMYVPNIRILQTLSQFKLEGTTVYEDDNVTQIGTIKPCLDGTMEITYLEHIFWISCDDAWYALVEQLTPNVIEKITNEYINLQERVSNERP